MARNRRDIDAVEKRNEIVIVARRLLMDAGYDATSMARIASEARVAPNTLYWYFKDKDALLVAILDALVTEALQEYSRVASLPLVSQLLWMLEKFDQTAGFVTTVHARMTLSSTIHAWHERFHQLLEALIMTQLAIHGLPDRERAPAARIVLFVMEGLLSHHAGEPVEREAIASLLVSRVLPAGNV
ncbi:MAG: helix-turn-helix domain-containing protein [Gammaproteobacteria bacterium]|jgi:AcrR family transcriptional regulator